MVEIKKPSPPFAGIKENFHSMRDLGFVKETYTSRKANDTLLPLLCFERRGARSRIYLVETPYGEVEWVASGSPC